MSTPIKTDYGMRVQLTMGYEEAVTTTTAALKEQGFGVLTEIDVQATLKKKIGADFRRYVILGACNPNLANQALNTELEIGLLLPCNVIVYEDGTGSVVSIADPSAMLRIADAPALNSVMLEARTRLQNALAALESA